LGGEADILLKRGGILMLVPGKVVEFDRKKLFKYIKPLGSGGTGDTHLFIDEITDMLFAIKKFVPKDINCRDDHFRRFVDEIKILMKLSHPNIVRVYNYYLYPEPPKTGYLQMEYIDGSPIDNFKSVFGGKSWEAIFSEAISAFDYLEIHHILHRDIRPANIMVDTNGSVKIIDFGFGKQLQRNCQVAESVFLNWPVTEMPNEVEFDQEYTHRTEIFFVGKLFQRLLHGELESFKYSHIIERMIKNNPVDRYASFSDIANDISAGILGDIDFSDSDKEAYLKFADNLIHVLNYHVDYCEPQKDVNQVIASLGELIRCSALEKHLQDNARMLRCFLVNGFNYMNRHRIEVDCVKQFYQLLTRFSPRKQKVILDNIGIRLSRVNIKTEDEEIPF
jgi:serine/threonine-protein kinase